MLFTMQLNEKIHYQDLQLYYQNFGHEHVSYGPDEPFEATVGVYFFEISTPEEKDSYTFYQENGQPSSPVIFKNYRITLIEASDDQKTVKIQIEAA